MAKPRFFIDYNKELLEELRRASSKHVEIALNNKTHKHLSKVLRIKPGEEIEVMMRDEWAAFDVELIEIDTSSIIVISKKEIKLSRPAVKLRLFFGLSKGDKNETIIRQAVELGASVLVPVEFERSVVKLDEKRKTSRLARFNTKSESAAMQAHRSFIPKVHAITKSLDLDRFISSGELSFVLWEETESQEASSLFELLSQELSKTKDDVGLVNLIVGPEGGITQKEIEFFEDLGVCQASLGPNILRVDTANCAALTQALLAIDRADTNDKN